MHGRDAPDPELMRWEDDGGYCPPEPDFGPSPLRAVYTWWLTYDMLRRLFL